MKRILLLFLAAALSSTSFGQSIAKGYVYEDANANGKRDRREKGLPGVAVSDGVRIAVTDSKGYYELPVGDHCVIFVVKPRGYIAPVNEKFQPVNYYIHKPVGSPEQRYKGSEPTGSLPVSLDFALLPYEERDEFRFFAFGDPQPYSVKEVEYFTKAIVEEAKEYEGVSFGISLGDIVGDNLELHPLYLDAIKGMGLPWYNVIGNHDRNYDATEDRFSNETFEANFGPSNYAFRYGNAHFIALDDIILSNPPKGAPYVGGFRDDQLEFLENYMRLVERGELVVISYHIPIAYKTDQFNDAHRRRFFEILRGHNVLGLSAHTHIQMQFFIGAEYGWEGEKPYHEYNVGTTNGDWYSGKLDERGLPDATMRDGTPQGYAIVTVKGGEYTLDYKVAGEPADRQMTIYTPRVVPYKQGGKYPIYVNFYMGSPGDLVEYRVDKGPWRKMSRVVDELDPTFMNLVYEWDSIDHARQGRRPSHTPGPSTHLWKATLDNTIEPGEHRIDVRAKDMFGRIHKGSHTYRVEKL